MLSPSDFRLKRYIPIPGDEPVIRDYTLDELLDRWNERCPVGSVAPFYDDEYEEMRYYEMLRGEE